MLIYEYKIRDLIERVRMIAQRILDKLDNNFDCFELLEDSDLLKEVYTQFQKKLPKAIKSGKFDQHFAFLQHYLRKRDRNYAQMNLQNIIKYDLPELENSFKVWCASYEHYDRELAEKVSELLQENHLPSAVRAAFVILKERLAATYSLSSDLDGEQLVNRIFGSRGMLSGTIDNSRLQAMRNLLSGLYGVFRNKYSHTDVKTEWNEAEAVIAMVNWVLKNLP